MPHQDHVEVERRYLQMYAELKSRAFAASWGLTAADREEFCCECTAWAWEWCLSAARRGKLDRLTPFTLVSFASKQWWSGRRFGMTANINDAMDEQARARGRVRLERLDDLETERVDNTIRGRRVSSALTDSKRAQPDEQVRTELDYALVAEDEALPSRAKECFEHLVADHERGCLTRISGLMGLSVPRVHQLKTMIGEALGRIGYAPAAA